MEIIEKQVPIESSLAESLIRFWESIFKISFAELRGVLTGEEVQENDDIFFLACEENRLVGTSHITMKRPDCRIAGLGEVAVDPAFRGRGIAGALCSHARDAFRNRGGEAIFLGTSAPNAARVYARLGWEFLPGTSVMLQTLGPASPQEFLASHFDEAGPVLIAEATAADRLGVIPLLVAPHEWQVLDANLQMFSTRYAQQNSCMGLYPRYQAIRDGGRGNWYSARTRDGRVVGLSSVRVHGDGKSQIDAFAHSRHLGCMSSLIENAAQWATSKGAATLQAHVLEDDAAKLELFEQAGFRTVALADPLETSGQRLPALHLEMPASFQEIASGQLHPELRVHFGTKQLVPPNNSASSEIRSQQR